MSFECAYLSKRGGQSVNRDAVQVLESGRGLCAVVADGVGGHGHSEIAARLTVDMLIESYSRNGMRSAFSMKKNILHADSKIREKQNQYGAAMQTTLAALTIENGTALWCHVGDARIYHFVNDRLVSCTKDHSMAQAAVCLGEIAEDELRFHSDRSRIFRSLGGENSEPEIVENVPLSKGFHAFLICTDGFWQFVYEAEMERLLSEAKNPDQWLSDMETVLCHRAGEHEKYRGVCCDNYTAVTIFYLE